MIQRMKGLDAVDQGPLPSDRPERVVPARVSTPSDHPSVAALESRFGSAILRHRVSAGDQTVVWSDPARNL